MISKRLLEVAQFVEDKSSVIDIGCDHALLDIYLFKNKNNIKLLAVDVNANALDGALKNLKKQGLEKIIKIKKSDGLKNVNILEIDTIIIAGLGGRKINSLLKEEYLGNVGDIILQPTNNVEKVRKHLMELGYYIFAETLVQEKRLIYTTILFKKGCKKYSNKELYFGPILLKEKNPLFMKKISKEIEVLTASLKHKPPTEFLNVIKIEKKIKQLQKLMN